VAQVLKHLDPDNACFLDGLDEGGSPNMLRSAKASQRKHQKGGQEDVKQLEKSSDVGSKILEGFKPLFLVLRQIDCQYALLNELFIG
jgi:hypothetical protein